MILFARAQIFFSHFALDTLRPTPFLIVVAPMTLVD
jgi:hypothetical protein